VDRLFHDYMLHNEVPHWARSYARRILRLEESGRLNADQPQYHRYDHSFVGPALSVAGRFWMAMGCIAGVVGLVVILLEYSPGTAVSPFPPYFNEQELRQIPPP